MMRTTPAAWIKSIQLPSRSHVALWLGYLAVVLALAYVHTFWRDEVRAFSISKAAGSTQELFRLLKNEGHPPLWYLVLRSLYLVFDSNLVLPLAGFLFAAGFSYVLLRWSPFSLLECALLCAGKLFVIEYSVMCRNYGIGLFFLFVFAVLHRTRLAHRFALFAVLGLLALTSAHAFLIAGALAGLVILESCLDPGRWRDKLVPLLPGLAFFLAAVALSAWTATPDANSRVFSGSVPPKTMLSALGHVMRSPGRDFQDLFADSAAVTALYFLCVAVYLVRKPTLLLTFAAGFFGLSLLSETVHRIEFRHQGLLFGLTLVLLWISRESGGERALGGGRRWSWIHSRKIFPAVFLGFLAVQAVDGGFAVHEGFTRESSGAWRVGRFVRSTPAYSDAIILGEKNTHLETLAYYLDNRLYFPRSKSFGTWTRLTSDWKQRFSLGELLDAAVDLRRSTKKPVLVVFSFPEKTEFVPGSSGERDLNRGANFTWEPAEVARFLAATRKVARFEGALVENYTVYELR